MVTTSYPRFPGDSVGTFMEPIAKAVAARGHEVHIVAPWHPRITRGSSRTASSFTSSSTRPSPALNVFGYAAALRADVNLRGAAYAAAPLALAAGWFSGARVAQTPARDGHARTLGHPRRRDRRRRRSRACRSSSACTARTSSSPRTLAPARFAARRVFRRAGCVTACSDDLARRAIALGAAPDRVEVVPYGVDADRFRPDPARAGFAPRDRRASASTARWSSPPAGWCARRASST